MHIRAMSSLKTQKVCSGNIFFCFSRERFTGLEVGQPEIDQDTPGKAFVYFTAMVREATEY